MKLLRVLSAAGIFSLLATACVHWEYNVPNEYAEYRLLPLTKYDHSFARAVTNERPFQVAGYSQAQDGATRACVWVLNETGASVQARALSGNESKSSQALDINSAGDVVGIQMTEADQARAIVWRKGTSVDIHRLLQKDSTVGSRSLVSSRASAIDQAGRVFGSFEDERGIQRGFILDGDRIEIFEFTSKPGPGQINSYDEIIGLAVGTFSDTPERPRSFRLQFAPSGSSKSKLEFFQNEDLALSQAFGLNRFGHIVGETRSNPSGLSRAFLSVKGRHRDLGVLAGGQSSVAYGVNRNTKIVGSSAVRNGEARAFVWAPAFGMYDLNKRAQLDAARVLTHARAINDQEVIAGDAAFGDRQHAFALIPGAANLTPLACNGRGPSSAMSRTVLNYEIECENRSMQEVRNLALYSEIPEGTQLVSAADGGGSQPPNSQFTNGQIKWQLSSLASGAKVTRRFSVLSDVADSVTLSKYGASTGRLESDVPASIYTKLTPPDSRKFVQFLTPRPCEAQASNADLDFDLSVNGFVATKMELQIGGNIVARDKQEPWSFSIDQMPRGIHCLEGVATTTSGTQIKTDPLCLTVGLSEGAKPIYSVLHLSNKGGSASEARGLNQRGDVVGWAQNSSNQTQTALWFTRDENSPGASSVSPTLIPMPTACAGTAGSRSIGSDITDDGQLLGVCGPVWKQSSFVWKNGRSQLISIEDKSVRGMAISANGQVVGRFGAGGQSNYAFTWARGAGETPEIKFLFGISDSPTALALDVNNRGIVVGASLDLQSRAVLWSDGLVSEMTTSGGPSRALAINNESEPSAVGEMSVAGRQHAFLWNTKSGLVDLHDSKKWQSSRALGLNDFRQVVGSFRSASGAKVQNAFLRTCNERFDLNQLIAPDSGWVLKEAVGINKAGEIVGNGIYRGKRAAFILVP